MNYNLNKKYAIERTFHDEWAKSIKSKDINFRMAFKAETAIENRFALSQMPELKGKRILDLGCGMGDASLFFASQGARVCSIDISPGMISLVKKMSTKFQFGKNIDARVMVAEKLEFPNEHFDIVFGNGVLHHVIPSLALKEVYRVLKPGGVATFIEPLRHNPIINIYRKIADKVRTPTEKPLDYYSLTKLTKEKFRINFHEEFHLFTLLIFIKFLLIDGVNPNKERYWKKIIDDEKKIKREFHFLYNIDNFIFRWFKSVRKYAWNTVIVYIK